MANIDEISPNYVGEDKITLSLHDPQSQLLANVPFQIDINYDGASGAGIMLPLELIVNDSGGKESRKTFTRTKPSSLLLKLSTRGPHSILLKELYHNRWQGRIIVTLQGEDLRVDERIL